MQSVPVYVHGFACTGKDKYSIAVLKPVLYQLWFLLYQLEGFCCKVIQVFLSRRVFTQILLLTEQANCETPPGQDSTV